MKKLLFVLLLLAPLSFAAWVSVAAMAVMVSVVILAAVYGVAIGIESEELKVLSKDEFFQLIVLVLLIAVFFIGDGMLNAISTNSAFTQGQPTIQDAAIVSLDETYDKLSLNLEKIASSDVNVAKEASRTLSCYITGGGYSVSACGGFTMLGTPFSFAGSLTAYAIAEVSAVKQLVIIARDYALALLLPIGIILRTFRFSRGAGGFLIALGISLYLLVPAGIVFVDMLNEQFLSDPVSSEYTEDDPSALSFGDPDSSSSFTGCEAGMPWGDYNEDRAIDAYQKLRTQLKYYLYIGLLKATLGPVVALLLFIGGLRALSSIFGMEVDVSPISRFV